MVRLSPPQRRFDVRVVYLTTEFPWPATSGGPVRTLAQLRILGSLPEVERITLLSVTERTVTDAECVALAAAVPKLAVVPPVFHPIHLWQHPRHVPRVLRLRLSGIPYLAAKWDSRTLRRTLRRELQTSAADVVYIDHLGMARYLADIRAERPARASCSTSTTWRATSSSSSPRTRAGRRSSSRRPSSAGGALRARVLGRSTPWSRSPPRTRHTSADRGVPAHVVPIVMAFERRARPPGPPHFCYVGNLRWHPNVAGLDWFCQLVWPQIRARVPDATLEIAGVGLRRDASGRLAVPAAWKAAGIETVGFLEDLEPLYARSLAMLAPVRAGAGVRVKMLEGFRAGLPVVTTPDGASGLPLTDGKEVLVAGDPDAFAERVERLVGDGALRARLRDRGYAYLETSHSDAAARRPLRGALGL